MFSAQLTSAEAHLVTPEAGLRGLIERGSDHNMNKHTGPKLMRLDIIIFIIDFTYTCIENRNR